MKVTWCALQRKAVLCQHVGRLVPSHTVPLEGCSRAHLYAPARHEAPATPSTPTPTPPASLTAWRHLIPRNCPFYLYLFVVQLLHDAAAEDLQGGRGILLSFSSQVQSVHVSEHQVCLSTDKLPGLCAATRPAVEQIVPDSIMPQGFMLDMLLFGIVGSTDCHDCCGTYYGDIIHRAKEIIPKGRAESLSAPSCAAAHLIHGLLSEKADEPKASGPLVVMVIHHHCLLHRSKLFKVLPAAGHGPQSCRTQETCQAPRSHV